VLLFHARLRIPRYQSIRIVPQRSTSTNRAGQHSSVVTAFKKITLVAHLGVMVLLKGPLQLTINPVIKRDWSVNSKLTRHPFGVLLDTSGAAAYIGRF
jgi:hypothetical protein